MPRYQLISTEVSSFTLISQCPQLQGARIPLVKCSAVNSRIVECTFLMFPTRVCWLSNNNRAAYRAHKARTVAGSSSKTPSSLTLSISWPHHPLHETPMIYGCTLKSIYGNCLSSNISKVGGFYLQIKIINNFLYIQPVLKLFI